MRAGGLRGASCAGARRPEISLIQIGRRTRRIPADELAFGNDERGLDDLRLQFEAISHFDADEKKTAKEVLDGLILKHEARRWAVSE